MGADGQVHPESDTWVASVHASREAYESLGSGIVLDDRRILTCAHVAGLKDDAQAWAEKSPVVWIAFPKAEQGDSDQRVPVEKVVFPAIGARIKDLAVLYLARPVPPGVTAAPLRCPRPADLVKRRWWAFGFPDGDPIGDDADGLVGAALGHGWIRLDTGSRYPVLPGFSGGGLWSPDYRAVVAVVGQARGDRGDGRAITLHQADEWFPDEKIRSLAERWLAPEAGEVAMSAWGWSLSEDVEGTRHWRPRARGVSVDSERGYRFRGRTKALEVIRAWLDQEDPDGRVLVVTGAPGTGKSAVLGRIVTTADDDAARQLPASDTAIRATDGSVGCAVHAKGKTALEVATEIARAASAALPERVEDFAPALHDVLERRGRRLNVIIDALDEAANPDEARAVISKVILPVAETCADVGAQVVVGSRRADGDGDLLRAFGGAARLVDLDEPEFFADEDLVAYALATLQLAGHERPGNPYAADAVAGPVAARIADLSEGNFLVAGLTARAHGLYDNTAVDPATLSFGAKVDDAMREYLSRIPVAVAGMSTETLLTALAFAEAPGLPADLWRAAVQVMGAGDVPETELIRFARSSAASFLVETSGGDGQSTVFRLFHQALNDSLLHARARVADPGNDQEALARVFFRAGRMTGWERAPEYLLRSLPAHAAVGGLVDELLADNEYLLHADLRRLMQAAGQAVSPEARDRVRLLGHTPEAVVVGPAERAAMFSVTEALDGLGTAYRVWPQPVPYRAQWAVAQPGDEILTLRGHQDWVNTLCEVRSGNRVLLAVNSGGRGAVSLWDPADGSLVRTLGSHWEGVTAVCGVWGVDRALLAIGGDDGAVSLWDPADGSLVRTLDGLQGRVLALCEVRSGDRTLLATGSDDGAVRLWDPADGSLARTLGYQDWVRALREVRSGDRVLLAVSSGDGGAVSLWDPADGSLVRTLDGLQGRVLALCEVRSGDRTLLATGSDDGAVRLWDLRAVPSARGMQDYPGGVRALCGVWAGGRTLLASGSNDGAVRLWDPADGFLVRTLGSHPDGVTALCEVRSGDSALLATSDRGGAVRLWDPDTGSLIRTLEDSRRGVTALCGVWAGGRTLLASGGNDGAVRLWDPADGFLVRTLGSHPDGVTALCEVWVGDRILLAASGYGGPVRLWDPADGFLVRTLGSHPDGVTAICGMRVGNRTLLAAAGAYGGPVRLWDLTDGSLVRTLDGQPGKVNAMCEVSAGSRALLVICSHDETVRLCDLDEGRCMLTMPVHHAAQAATAVVGSLAVGLDAGVLVVTIEAGISVQ